MDKKDNRFEEVYSQGTFNLIKVYRDKETGAQYLYITNGNAAGLTVLLDSEGRPLIER